nr:AraC family transcriptional regulator [Sedimentibacter sp.]
MDVQNTVMKTVNYIEKNLYNEINLDEISDAVNYSKFHLNRLFADRVGLTIYKYVQMRRLTEAARKLIKTDMPIVEIAMEANYNSQQAFTLAFKQVYIYTPQVYRAMGVFVPKQNRFSMNSRRMSQQNIFTKCGVMAA